MKFRISLKWQLSFAVSFTAFCCLGLLSIITYFNNQGTVLDLRRNRLTVIAQLKSSQISYYLKSLQTGSISLGSREFLQTLLMDSYNGAQINITAQVDPFVTALESSDGLGGVIYDYQFNQIAAVLLDDPITQNVTEWPLSMLPVTLSPFQKQILRSNSWMLQGPEIINSNNDFVFSMTTAVGKNGFEFPQVNGSIVGYITVLVKANGLMSILNMNDAVTEASKSDLSLISLTDDTSEAIYKQFNPPNDTFLGSLSQGMANPAIDGMQYTYALPTNSCLTCYTYDFPLNANEGVYEAFLGYYTENTNVSYGSLLNVQYARTNVAVGYSKVSTNAANSYPRWAVIAAQSHSDVYRPLYTLRNILLISVFSLGAGVCLVTLILASWAVGPILRLQAATDRSTGRAHKLAWWRNLSWKRRDEDRKPAAKTSINTLDTEHSEKAKSDVPESTSSEDTRVDSQSKAFHRRHDSQELKKIASNPNMEFKVPAKVENRKRFVIDELSELTDTFNIMAEELRKQYDTLDQQVKQRTKEIESAKELAETANEAKTLFIANITHELQTPLNAILGLTAVCMGEKDVVKVKRNLKVIYQSGELLLHLLTDLLTFSKNQLGKLTLYEVDFTVSEVVMQLDSIFGQPCEDLNINFTINSSDHALVLHGDMNRMLQVAINLISSSLKSLTGGDSVEVTVKVDIEKLTSGMANKRHSLLASSTRARGNSLTLANTAQNSPSGSFTSATNRESVSSISGTGFLSLVVNTEHTEHDLNEGKDISNAIQNSGTELGLSICRQLAELMDGEVNLENPFWFRLPVKIGDRSGSGIEEVIQPKAKKKSTVSSGLVIQPPPAKECIESATSPVPATPVPPPAPSPVPAHPLKPTQSSVTAATCKVLIVEDNHVNKEVMTRMLNLEGIRDVTVAVDGLKAVEAVEAILAEGQMFDVIFMDVQMPVMDGREATRIIRSKLGYTNPIIAVSAYADQSNINDCLATGMETFLAKPLKRPQLREVLINLGIQVKERK
ncbi:Histidine protein kinase SLN1 [Yarrowia sp. B02]|nr:Histidine protein kinase SLN1 [Yarrowia sp. B02]